MPPRRNLKQLQRAVADAPTDRARAVAEYALAVFHDNNGREADAIPHYRCAIALGLENKEKLRAGAWLASSLYKTGQPSAAMQQVDKLLALNCPRKLKRFLVGLRDRIRRDPAMAGYRNNAPAGLTLRGHTEGDWEAVRRVHDAARVQELAAGTVDPRAFRPMVEVAAAEEFFDSETVVACLDDAVVGFVSWNGAYISWLYVEPDVQRRGIGWRLLEHAMREIGPQAWTNMIAGNDAALALYQRAGMEVVWTRRGECEGYPCQTMRLALPSSRMRNPKARRE